MLSVDLNPTVVAYNNNKLPETVTAAGGPRSMPQRRTEKAGTFALLRSVPPHRSQDPLYSPVLMDAYGIQTRSPRYTPVSSLSASGYAQRFKSRPKTTTAKLVEFDCSGIKTRKDISKSRGIDGFFPPMKLRSIAVGYNLKTDESTLPQKLPIRLQSSPAGVASRTRSKSTKSVITPRLSNDLNTPRTIDLRIGCNVSPVSQADTLRSSTEVDDLTYLPPPRKVLKKDESPWAFRCKVKSNMNSLAKIMASKPPVLPSHIW